MKNPTKGLAIGGLALALTLGGAGVVMAAGAQGNGPASALSGLVSDGTITQDQADKVGEALESNREERRAAMDERRAGVQKVVTSVLGISETDLETARKDGKTLTEIAGSKSTELQAALTVHVKASIAKEAADGSITSEQAAKATSNVDEIVDGIMNNDGPRRGGPGGPGGRGGPGAPEGADGGNQDAALSGSNGATGAAGQLPVF